MNATAAARVRADEAAPARTGPGLALWIPLIPAASGALGVAAVAWTLWQRASALQLTAYDTAFFEQVVWNLGHGHGFVTGFFAAPGRTVPANFLGLHFSPLLALPAAVQLAWPDAHALSLLTALALGLSAPAAYLMLRALLGDRPGAPAVSAALAAGLPFWLAVQQAAHAGFHTEVLALPLALTAAWAGLRGRTLLCWACALLVLCAKEDQAYAVMVVGILLAVHGPSRRQGVAMAALAVVWAGAMELVLMPALRGAATTYDVANYYAWLHHPTAGRVLAALANGTGWLGFGAAVLAMAGLPLLRPAWLALALPVVLGDLLSADTPQSLLHLQYALPLVVPVMVAGGLGARTLLDRLRPRPALLAALALPAVVTGLVFTPMLSGVQLTSGTTSLQQLTACTSAVPANVPVAADDSVAVPLAARPIERPLTWARSGDWVVVDRGGYVPDYVNSTARTNLLSSLSGQDRHLYCDDGRFQVWGPVNGG